MQGHTEVEQEQEQSKEQVHFLSVSTWHSLWGMASGERTTMAMEPLLRAVDVSHDAAEMVAVAVAALLACSGRLFRS